MRNVVCFLCVALALFLPATDGQSADVPPVRIAYFVPRDREPIPGYQQRVDRVMQEVQRFYREGMNAAGYGPMTFALERSLDDALVVHLVQAQEPMAHYGRDASADVRREVQAALAKSNIDMDQNTWVIFQVLLQWDGDRATEVGPYVGGGNHLAGTAWVYDDERLDPQQLASQAKGGYYGRPCSLGEFNSHYIGGVAHELGHAFGLPHDCQRQSDLSRGLSLMGGGNHTYGQELRGEGTGAYLNAGSAMLLAHSRPFAGDLPQAKKRPTCQIQNFDAQFVDGKIVLTGQITADPPAFGIVAFDDWAQVPSDYDAVTWTCGLDQGRFRLEIGELRVGASQLRLWVCHDNGATSRFEFDYQVDQSGIPNLDALRYSLPLSEAIAAYYRRDRTRARAAIQDLERRFSNIPEVQRKAAHLQTLLNPPRPLPLSQIKSQDGWTCITRAPFVTAQVGWGRPLVDEVLGQEAEECFLSVGGEFFERGLFAHAPAKHAVDLATQWTRFRAGYGLQDGHAGSVVFVIRGDGKELFRSTQIRDHQLRHLDVDVTGVKILELIVEDGGDGTHSDWGVWLQPELSQVHPAGK